MSQFIKIRDLDPEQVKTLRATLQEKTGLEFYPDRPSFQGAPEALVSTRVPMRGEADKIQELGEHLMIKASSKGYSAQSGKWSGQPDDKLMVIHEVDQEFLEGPQIRPAMIRQMQASPPTHSR